MLTGLMPAAHPFALFLPTTQDHLCRYGTAQSRLNSPTSINTLSQTCLPTNLKEVFPLLRFHDVKLYQAAPPPKSTKQHMEGQGCCSIPPVQGHPISRKVEGVHGVGWEKTIPEESNTRVAHSLQEAA